MGGITNIQESKDLKAKQLKKYLYLQMLYTVRQVHGYDSIVSDIRLLN